MGLNVGITGGIGSGKTTICHIFELLGIPVYYADERAKELMRESGDLKNRLVETFGADIYDKNGLLQTKRLANLVFNDTNALERLNNIVHPAVFQDSANWLAKHTEYTYTLREAALLFESGSYRQLNVVISVSAPVELRMERVQKRDGISEQQFLERMRNQWTDERKCALADYVILNDGSHSLIDQVLHLHRLFIRQSTAHKY